MSFINFDQLKTRAVVFQGWSGYNRLRPYSLPDTAENRICGFGGCEYENQTEEFVNKIHSLGGAVWFRDHSEQMNVSDTVRIVGNDQTDWYQILLYVTKTFKPDEIVDRPDFLEFWWD